MNNETQPTPEQLATCRKEFAKAFPARPLSEYGAPPSNNDYVFVGYIRAKQENEQELKAARKLALQESIELCSNTMQAIEDPLAKLGGEILQSCNPGTTN